MKKHWTSDEIQSFYVSGFPILRNIFKLLRHSCTHFVSRKKSLSTLWEIFHEYLREHLSLRVITVSIYGRLTLPYTVDWRFSFLGRFRHVKIAVYSRMTTNFFCSHFQFILNFTVVQTSCLLRDLHFDLQSLDRPQVWPRLLAPIKFVSVKLQQCLWSCWMLSLQTKMLLKNWVFLLTDKRLDIPLNHQQVFNQHSKHIGAQIFCTKLIGEAVPWTTMTLQRFWPVSSSTEPNSLQKDWKNAQCWVHYWASRSKI